MEFGTMHCLCDLSDAQGRQIHVSDALSPFKSEIDLILHNIITLQSSDLDCKGKHMMKNHRRET
ncbi:hypothetical protein Bca101_081452 [Brassica carinata]